MPSVPPLTRVLGSVLLAGIVGLAGPVSVLAAPQPTPGYQPAFVTEREDGPWEDCIWAAAAMLLDKWTSGNRIVSRERLRSLSGDRTGGSSLADVRRAFDKLGMRLTFSPGGGASITWKSLLDRLASGGGAIVLGDDHALPARYGRWDPDFWSRSGTGDDHALYLDRYDRRSGRILVMDPLAPDDWGGEWIPASAIRKFAWKTGGGSLWAAMTPPARAVPPFEGVVLGTPAAQGVGDAVTVTWPVQAAPEGWAFSGASVTTDLAALGVVDPLLPAIQVVASAEAGGSTPGASVDGLGGGIAASIVPHAVPGLYRLSVGVAELTSGRNVAAAGPYALYVAGPRAASVTVQPQLVLDAGTRAQVPVLVTNTGQESWADPPLVGWLPLDAQHAREVRVVGRWVALTAGQAGTSGAGAAGPFLPSTDPAFAAGGPGFGAAIVGRIDLGALHLETGEARSLLALVQAPARPGPWLLVFEVIDEAGRSLALAGSAPGIVAVEVRPPTVGSVATVETAESAGTPAVAADGAAPTAP